MKCKKCGCEYNGVFCPECGTKNEPLKTRNAETAGKAHKKISWKGIVSALLGMAATGFKGKIVVLEVLGLFFGIISKTRHKKRAKIAIMGILLNILAFAMFCYFPSPDGASPLEKALSELTEVVEAVRSDDSTKDEDNKLGVGTSTIADQGTENSDDGQSGNLMTEESGSGYDSEEDKYDDILNSYDVRIAIFGSEGSLEKYRHDTEVYLDGEKVPTEFSSEIYIRTVLREGEHELWLTKMTNKKERESNKIEFSVSPAYTNQLAIEASLESKKKYSLSVYKENNELYEGYETQYFDGQEIIRTANGKQIYYKVEFLVNNKEFVGDSSIFPTSTIDIVKVAKGDAAIPPSAPDIKNYEFIGWSEDISNIQSDLEVYALYELREVDWYTEYVGRYESRRLSWESDDYTCSLEINRITNIGIYFSLKFIDNKFGEVYIDNEFAEWLVEGVTAKFSYDDSSEDVGKYSFRLQPFVYEEEVLAVLVVDDYGNTNADARYEKVD